jgi:hypothetical protein
MAVIPRKRIRLLPTLIGVMKKVCKVLPLANITIRPFVPADYLEGYDLAVTQILNGCEYIHSIPYADTDVGTNPPWGS